MYKAVVFDFDYTLGDSTSGIVMSANYALEKLGYPRQETEAIRRTVGLTLPESFRALTGVQDPAAGQAYADFFHEKAETVMTDNTSLYPGALSLLAGLRQRGLKTAIVTTKAHRTIQRIAERYGALPLLDRLVGGDDVAKEKPDPEGLLGVAAGFGLAMQTVLYVGDSLVDAKTALAARAPFAAVLTGTTPAGAFAPYSPVFIGGDLAGIEEYILRALAGG